MSIRTTESLGRRLSRSLRLAETAWERRQTEVERAAVVVKAEKGAEVQEVAGEKRRIGGEEARLMEKAEERRIRRESCVLSS